MIIQITEWGNFVTFPFSNTLVISFALSFIISIFDLFLETSVYIIEYRITVVLKVEKTTITSITTSQIIYVGDLQS